MKIKLDENIPLRTQSLLTQLGHDVETVPQENLAGCIDEQIWQAAQESSRFLITRIWTFQIFAALHPEPMRVSC